VSKHNNWINSKVFQQWKITLKMTWFLDFVYCLAFWKEHNILGTKSVPFITQKGRRYITASNKSHSKLLDKLGPAKSSDWKYLVITDLNYTSFQVFIAGLLKWWSFRFLHHVAQTVRSDVLCWSHEQQITLHNIKIHKTIIWYLTRYIHPHLHTRRWK